MALLRVGALPEASLAAAARFHAETLPRIAAALAGADSHLVIVFEPADYTHRSWRLAAVQQLARDHAPLRVNALAADDARAIAAAEAYLGAAPGVTGQYLLLDGQGAEKVLSKTG
ncbi:MAG: Rossmann fold domain-containing protein [Novosphingobium sp.]